MNIKVSLEYRDSDKRILRGIYSPNDPALYGLGDYLVNAGHARYTNEVNTQEAPIVDTSNQFNLDLRGNHVQLNERGELVANVENVGTLYNIGIDNAVDGAELTVAFALTDEQETPIVSDSPELEEIELRQRYEELSGRAPHPAMKLETLRAKVAELEA